MSPDTPESDTPTDAPPPSSDAITLELSLTPEDEPLLLRQPELRTGASRRRAAGTRVSMIWHDTPEANLAQDGLALAECHRGAIQTWQLERLVADTAIAWPPGGVTPVLEHSPIAPKSHASHRLPVAGFEGQQRLLTSPDAPVQITLLSGTLRAITTTRPVCRVILTGENPKPLALAWSARLRLRAPPSSLAAEAFALAQRPYPQRPLGAPSLSAAPDVSTGFAFVVAHLAGVIQHHASLAGHDRGPEPVHQMRVALRRLRSATALFRRAVACPELDDVNARLKHIGRVLGPARDWDVFTAGTGREVGEAFPHDRPIEALLAAAERRRLESYEALSRYLASAEWRALGIALADLALRRPWQFFTPADANQAQRHAEQQRAALSGYASHALSKRLDAVTAHGADLSGLAIEALHELRLHTKRLRYAAEFFSPLFPGRDTRRFLRRMMALQERLGTLNDGAVAAALMQQLPGRGPGRQYAIGVVRGYVAARAGFSRRKIDRSWQRFRRQEAFWK